MAKIVCVEDEPGIREDIVEALEMQGHKIIEAENGREGLEAILRERPDLTISDITMPMMDGLGLLGEIRAHHPEFADMPFLFLSALADRKDQIFGRELGADEYLTKPVDFELMHVVVKAKLRQVQRMQVQKDRQLLKMYGALANMPILEEEIKQQHQLAGRRLHIICVAADDMDLTEMTDMIKSSGHALYCMNSGRKFIEAVDILAPDLLLITFNTEDLQAPMVMKTLLEQGSIPYQKILLMPPSLPDFPAMGTLPTFDQHIRIPVDCQALKQQIDLLSQQLKDTEDLLEAG